MWNNPASETGFGDCSDHPHQPGVVDQTLSSASNMLALFAIAGVSSVREFGVISLAIAGVMVTVALCRGLLERRSLCSVVTRR